MKITEIKFYGGSRERITKLGLSDLFIELQEILLSIIIFLLEKKDALKYIEVEFKEAQNYPIVIMAVEHDGPGIALKKQNRIS